MVNLRVTSHQDGSLMTGNYKIFPYVDPTSNAVVEIRGNWRYSANRMTYLGSQIWMGSEPFAAGTAPKNCFTGAVHLDGYTTTIGEYVFPLYTLGTIVTLKRTGERCQTTEKGTYQYQTCSGSCATGTDMDPGVYNVAVGKNTRGGGNPDLLDWTFIPVDWVKNGYYIRSLGSRKRFWAMGANGVKLDAISSSGGWKPANLLVQPYLKWGSYIGSYNNVGSKIGNDAEELGKFFGAFASGVLFAASAGFVDQSLSESEGGYADRGGQIPVYFTSFPPQFQTMSYPSHSLYKDLQTLPSQQQGGSKFDDKEYIFVIEPV
jgi:hypothetical protein